MRRNNQLGTTLPRRVGRLRRGLAGALLACCAGVLCGAGPPATGLQGLGRVVADEELSHMRGKFVQPSGVHFFGIEILQSWQGADGVTLHATLQFNVDFANGAGNAAGATPRLQIGWSRGCDGCGDASLDVPTLTQASEALPLGEFVTVNGIVQSQQIAGSDNSVQNAMRIAVVPVSSLPPGSGGSGEIQTSATQVLGDGDAIHFTVAQNELGLAMTRGGDMVRSGVGGPANQVAQEVVLQSSFNAIHNQVGITVGVDDVRQIDRINVGGAMTAMKGMGL